MFETILENVKRQSPVVHNITNYVTANDCANILLACGASPIMACDMGEVEEITAICSGLVLNIGTLNTQGIPSMIKAGKKANMLSRPVVLDPVGAGASKLRTETVSRLLNEVKFAAIRGNISEMKTVCSGSSNTRGVDAAATDKVTEENLEEGISFARYLSEITGAVTAITGAIDIVANPHKAYIIRNGHPMMAKITGTGCMLTAMIGAYCAANEQNLVDAVAAAICVMGLSGQLAYEKAMQNDGGPASMKMHLLDFISKMDADLLERGARIEIR